MTEETVFPLMFYGTIATAIFGFGVLVGGWFF